MALKNSSSPRQDTEQDQEAPDDIIYELPLPEPGAKYSFSGFSLPRTTYPAVHNVNIMLALDRNKTHVQILARFARDLTDWTPINFRTFLRDLHQKSLPYRDSRGNFLMADMPQELKQHFGPMHPSVLDDFFMQKCHIPPDFLIQMFLLVVRSHAHRDQPNIIFIGFAGSDELLKKFCEVIATPQAIITFADPSRAWQNSFQGALRHDYRDMAVEVDVQGLNEDDAYKALQSAFFAKACSRTTHPVVPTKKPFTLIRDNRTTMVRPSSPKRMAEELSGGGEDRQSRRAARLHSWRAYS